MWLCSQPSGRGAFSPDREDIPRRHQEHAAITRPRDQSSLPVLKRVQAGISRVRMYRGTPTQIRLPITAALLHQIRRNLDSSSHPDKLVLWAVCCTAFFGFFRLGELLLELQSAFRQSIHLAWGDVAVDSQDKPSMAQIHLKKSKTDQFGTGARIVLGRVQSALCPVAALLAACGDKPGPFFTNSSRKPLTKSVFVGEIRTILGALGVPNMLDIASG